MFPIVAVLSSIPVFSIVIKYNCIENGWSQKAGTFFGVIFPWVVAAPLLYVFCFYFHRIVQLTKLMRA